MYCTNCGKEVLPQAEFCIHCGVRPDQINNFCGSCGVGVRPEQEVCLKCGISLKKKFKYTGTGSNDLIYPPDYSKEPWLAAVLSFLIVGLGQIVLGQVKKGITLLIGNVFLALITFGISAFITLPIVIIDAYFIAEKLENGRPVGQWEFF